MVDVRPFRALRPPAQLAARVAALPYDVMDVAEARRMAAGNEHSFLHVSRPEIDLPEDVDPYDEQVYRRGRDNLDRLITTGALLPDPGPTFTVYRQRMGRHVQTGLVGLASVDEYESDVVAKHELTRPGKELDRVRHIDALAAQDEPVLLLAPADAALSGLLDGVARRDPWVDMTTDDGIGHTLWLVDDPRELARFGAVLRGVPRLYVADGHHRSAAASRVRGLRRERDRTRGDRDTPGWRPDDGFLSVIFPADQLLILPYHRAVADLGDRSADQVLDQLRTCFEVTAVESAPSTDRHVMGMYLAGRWFRLAALPGVVDENDPVGRLDVSVLQDRVLGSLLGVTDPRTDTRLTFIGGIRGTPELERLVDGGSAAVAFAMHATSVADLVGLADAGMIMPPKSTWFEPKLRSGLFVHPLDGMLR